MKTLKKLPYLFVFVLALVLAGCTEVAVEPVGADEETPIIIMPPPPK